MRKSDRNFARVSDKFCIARGSSLLMLQRKRRETQLAGNKRRVATDTRV